MKITPAGMKVLRAFDQGPDDPWKIDSIMMNDISFRSKVWSPQVYRVVDKLLRDGLLSDRPTHDGMRYSRTEAGTAALDQSKKH
ncbi:hypothetical protein KNLIENLN_00082 [Sinorhizobium phage NV1.1.1]|nr:hypothetical protein KNLIENLN_00082 [Sinorhizobium phage NV1.1.1]